jgi:hypothetical protein
LEGDIGTQMKRGRQPRCASERRKQGVGNGRSPHAHARPAPLPRPPQQAELEDEAAELAQLPRTPEVQRRLAEVRQELNMFRSPSASWWRFW